MGGGATAVTGPTVCVLLDASVNCARHLTHFDASVAGHVGLPATEQNGDVMGIDKFRFDGKQVLVVGGATGMGAASAVIAQDLGAQVTVMDYAEISLAGATAIKVDLRSEASHAPAQPMARPASRRSTSSAIATSSNDSWRRAACPGVRRSA
jgi:NADPH:quinone reductase-like Zn-dependent oxidoreductase